MKRYYIIKSQLSRTMLMCLGADMFVGSDEDGRTETFETDHGTYIATKCALCFRVSLYGKQRRKVVIALQPDDTYTVWVFNYPTIRQIARKTTLSKVLATQDQVYCDVLSDTVFEMVENTWKEGIAA